MRNPTLFPRDVFGRFLTLCLVLSWSIRAACPPSAAASAQATVTTTYQYNADGALTAITRQAADQAPTTTYLIWDDFLPDTADPTQGTVSRANGRLMGYGSSPAVPTTTFQFDLRDRLTGVGTAAQTETYVYHAKGTLASSSMADDTLQFYHDDGKSPLCTNIHQVGQNLWSGYLGGIRYLDDGTEQILLKPRKDTAMSYDARRQTVAPYLYDAYGARADQAPSIGYDLQDNPFQYAGEYRDPLWGGYYLRARWYQPDLPTFLSRDPMRNLNRYGYGGGNPVMRVDPSGRAFRWSRDIGRPLGRFLADINKGVGGHFARFFLSPILGPLQILANPKAYWEAIIHDKNGAAIFLVAPIVAGEGFGIVEAALGPAFWGEVFAARVTTTLGIGAAGSTVNASAHGFRHFNWDTFLDGEEGSVGSTLENSFGAGKGYNRFNRSGNDVADLVSKLDKAEPDTVLIVRQRSNLRIGPDGRSLPLRMQTGPIQEAMGLGLYHETILAISKDDIFTTEISNDGLLRNTARNLGAGAVERHFQKFIGKDFEVVGLKTNFDRANGFDAYGSQGFWTARSNPIGSDAARNPYQIFTNNCHHHASVVLWQLGF